MDEHNMKRIVTLCAFALLGVVGQSNASTFEGVIEKIQISAGASTVRVSIYVALHGSPCVHPNWFAFENADSGIGKVWTAALLAAHAAGKTVLITGTGSCDGYGGEGVFFVQVK
jgi:hypothetical protein